MEKEENELESGVNLFKPVYFIPENMRTTIEKDSLPKRYVINRNVTVLIWKDGSKTIVKRSKDDEYNKRLGFLTAYFQKHSGLSKNKANKYLDALVEEEEKNVKKYKTHNINVGDTIFHIDYGKGKVIEIADDSTDNICVEFKESRNYFHNCSGKGKENHCYWVSIKELVEKEDK